MRDLRFRESKLAQSQRSDQLVAATVSVLVAPIAGKLSARLMSPARGGDSENRPIRRGMSLGKAGLFTNHTDRRLEPRLKAQLVHICCLWPGDTLRRVQSCFKRTASLNRHVSDNHPPRQSCRKPRTSRFASTPEIPNTGQNGRRRGELEYPMLHAVPELLLTDHRVPPPAS